MVAMLATVENEKKKKKEGLTANQLTEFAASCIACEASHIKRQGNAPV